MAVCYVLLDSGEALSTLQPLPEVEDHETSFGLLLDPFTLLESEVQLLQQVMEGQP